MKNTIITRIFTAILTVTITVSSVFPTLAADEIIMNFESEYGEIVSSYYYPTAADELSATIKSDSVTVYDYIYDGAYGVTAEGLAGENIWLCQYIEYANGEVLYRYYLDDYNSDFYSTSISYQFISAKDVIIDGAEAEDEIIEDEVVENEVVEDEVVEDEVIEDVVVEDEVVEEEIVETPALTLDFLPEGLIAKSQTCRNATATINTETVKLYKSLDNGAEAIEISVDAGTTITLVTKYTFTKADGSTLVFYRYDYNGTNEALSDAAISEYSGYVFIYEEDITVNTQAKTSKKVVRWK